MKIAIIHLSDLHIFSNRDYDKISLKNKLDFFNDSIFENISDFLLVISGDLAFSASFDSYKYVGKIFDDFKKCIKEKYNKNLKILSVPGNHDLEFSKKEIADKKRSEYDYTKDLEKEKNRLNNYNNFCNSFSIPYVDFIKNYDVQFSDGFAIEFVLMNSSYFSSLDDSDYGKHYIPREELYKIGKPTSCNLKIGVIHHTLPWFEENTRLALSNMIKSNIQIMFIGHEHDFRLQETKTKKGGLDVLTVNGGAFYENNSHLSEFNSCILDTDTGVFTIYKTSWDIAKKIYVFSKIDSVGVSLSKGNKDFVIKSEKKNELNYILEKRNFNTFYIFPDMRYYQKEPSGKYKSIEIQEFSTFLGIIEDKKIIEVIGKSHNGKTALAKYLFMHYYKNTMQLPFILDALEYQEKLDKWEKDTFNSFFEGKTYENFTRLEPQNKILIIDNFHLIKKDSSVFQWIKDLLTKYSQVIIIQDDKSSESLGEQINSIVESDEDRVKFEILNLKPNKRQKLIYEVCQADQAYNSDKQNMTIANDIELFLRSQPSFVKFDPVLIMRLTSKYLNNTDHSKIDVFHDVFASSLNENIKLGFFDDTLLGEILLSNIAYNIYCEKEYPFRRSIIDKVVEQYNEEYDAHLDLDVIYNALLKTKIIKKAIDNKLLFESSNHLAFYIAKEVQRLKNDDEDFDLYNELIDNISTGINGDIILYLSLLENSIKESFKILDASIKNLDGVEMLKISDLFNDSSIVNVIDNQESEDKKREREEKKNETKEQKEYVELEKVNFFAPDSQTPEQERIANAASYLELNCKLFSNFYRRLKTEKKQELKYVLYTQINQMLKLIIVPFVNDYPAIKEAIVPDIMAKSEKMSRERAEKIFEMLFVGVQNNTILDLYRIVSVFSTSKKNVDDLIKYDFDKDNELLKVLNLFFIQRKNDRQYFYDQFKEYYSSVKNITIKNLLTGMFNNYLSFNHIVISDKERSVISTINNNNDRNHQLDEKRMYIDSLQNKK